MSSQLDHQPEKMRSSNSPSESSVIKEAPSLIEKSSQENVKSMNQFEELMKAAKNISTQKDKSVQMQSTQKKASKNEGKQRKSKYFLLDSVVESKSSQVRFPLMSLHRPTP